MGTCETCVFWRDRQWGRKGTCHRNPPQSKLILAAYGLGWTSYDFPWVKNDEWCGEHKHKDQTNA